jgi:putative glutamine amidotransferase
MPIIGVPPCRSLLDYLESVRRAGGDPRVLDPATDVAGQIVASVDGLLFTGGGDVDPARYGEQPEPSVAGVDPARDAFEIPLLQLAVANRLPLFGICRGMQVLNVALGGTLVQDVPAQTTTSLEHSKPTPLWAIAHEVWVTRGSRLAGLMRERLAGADSCAVNSRHHQAVRRLADLFEVSATAPDGVIEAIEHSGLPFCVAVQWHPENFWRTGEFRELFEGFVAACERRP